MSRRRKRDTDPAPRPDFGIPQALGKLSLHDLVSGHIARMRALSTEVEMECDVLAAAIQKRQA